MAHTLSFIYFRTRRPPRPSLFPYTTLFRSPPSSPDLSAGESGNTLQGFDRLGSELFVETARRESMTPVPCAEAGQVNISFTQLGVWRMVTLGIVQGITELLPISSTAHLRVIPSLLGWPDPGSPFSAAMQLASLLAVISFLGGDALRIAGRAADAARRGDWQDHSFRVTAGIVLGTLPIAIAGLALKRTLE